jgi:hypothetical protein
MDRMGAAVVTMSPILPKLLRFNVQGETWTGWQDGATHQVCPRTLLPVWMSPDDILDCWAAQWRGALRVGSLAEPLGEKRERALARGLRMTGFWCGNRCTIETRLMSGHMHFSTPARSASEDHSGPEMAQSHGYANGIDALAEGVYESCRGSGPTPFCAQKHHQKMTAEERRAPGFGFCIPIMLSQSPISGDRA